MLTLMNYWNSVWRNQLAEIENAFPSRSEAEERAFERRLKQAPRWRVYSGDSVRQVNLPHA